MQTPFCVEFARSSNTRGGSPTLVPVAHGGATVKATLLVLNAAITEQEAKNILWRRETRKIGTGKTYQEMSNPGPNRVLVKTIQVADVMVLYTDFPEAGKFTSPTAKQLAELAVASARNTQLSAHLNGISYLQAMKHAGINTPLLPAYENEVLNLMGTASLEAALAKLRD
jgi:hypothetical protein